MDTRYTFGLDKEAVEKSRREYGLNILTPPKKTPVWRQYLEKYNDPIIRILLVAVVVSFVFACIEGQYLETIGIAVAIFLATTIGFLFELDASKRFDELNAMDEEQPVKVIRRGKMKLIARKDVVVGDIVVLEVGDEVPADGVLFEAQNLQIDESSLTGETLTTKRANPSLTLPTGGGDLKDSPSFEKMKTSSSSERDGEGLEAYPSYMVLRSSMVMNGTGRFEVTAVGDRTEIGKVARKAMEQTGVKTPLVLQLERLAKQISRFGTGFSVLAFVLFLGRDILTQPYWHSTDYILMAHAVLTYFMMTVTLIVMAVPEGLPMAITLALALNMRRMLKTNNLVRKLHACETMGAVNIICTDKTGTLTENRMTVQELFVYNGAYRNEAIALNSTAVIDEEGKAIGNPTEAALIRYIEKEGVDWAEMRRTHKIVSRQPFSTELKYMSTDVEVQGSESNAHGLKTVHLVKGAPEIVLDMCEISDDDRAAVEARLALYQKKAMRTIAFAVDNKLQMVAAISDPLRQDVPAAVGECQSAGIEVKIVTGDTSATALEIARQIQAPLNPPLRGETNSELSPSPKGEGWDGASITGTEFATLSDEEAKEVALRIKVMSRARPTDKLRLVRLLQEQGNVVAVTGDGTNDAPALNYAHVGLSLGSGTSVAKNASDMTLLDDSFRSIVSAVRWGRSLYKNIQRFLFFQLTVNVAALLLVAVGAFIGTELPLTITQILWVNLIMDTFAAMALASLPPEDSVMNEKPRRQSDFILTPYIYKWIGWTGGLMFLVSTAALYYCENNDHTATVSIHELTMFFTFFVMLQWWNLFNAKALYSKTSAFSGLTKDKSLVFVLLMILLGQWIIVTLGGEMFRLEPLSVLEWMAIIAITSPVALVGEIVRRFKR